MIKTYDAKIVHVSADDVSIQFANVRYVYRNLRESFKDGEKITVEFKTRRKPRSLEQNAYLHMMLQMIADETGNDLDTVKSTVKAMYAKKSLVDRNGEVIIDKSTGEAAYYVQDTRNMSTVEAMEFTENVRMFALEFLGMVLPLPEEQIKANLK